MYTRRYSFNISLDKYNMFLYSCRNISAYAKASVLLLINEHNRVANLLRQKNVRWDAKTVFEESKRVVIAEIQHITYTQYLPLLLGEILDTVSNI